MQQPYVVRIPEDSVRDGTSPLNTQTNKTFFHQKAPEEVPPGGWDTSAAGPFLSPNVFILIATMSPWLPGSPAQVWAAPLSAPLLQSSDGLEFSKNSFTENQQSEQENTNG